MEKDNFNIGVFFCIVLSFMWVFSDKTVSSKGKMPGYLIEKTNYGYSPQHKIIYKKF
jgi:hypothetical protein